MDAESAISNLEHIGSVPRPEGFFDPATPGAENLKNSDLAFQGNYLFQGNYNGFQVFDISDPRDTQLEAGIICPTEQGDLTVYGDLLIVSAQSRASRLDCGVQGVADSISVERMKGIRIFDVSDLQNPRQVAAVQACRGSHTHSVLVDPRETL